MYFLLPVFMTAHDTMMTIMFIIIIINIILRQKNERTNEMYIMLFIYWRKFITQ